MGIENVTEHALRDALEERDREIATLRAELDRAERAAALHASQLEFGFLLHDIGKVAVPDAILVKNGRLTADEYALVRRHAEILRLVDRVGEGARP